MRKTFGNITVVFVWICWCNDKETCMGRISKWRHDSSIDTTWLVIDHVSMHYETLTWTSKAHDGITSSRSVFSRKKSIILHIFWCQTFETCDTFVTISKAFKARWQKICLYLCVALQNVQIRILSCIHYVFRLQLQNKVQVEHASFHFWVHILFGPSQFPSICVFHAKEKPWPGLSLPPKRNTSQQCLYTYQSLDHWHSRGEPCHSEESNTQLTVKLLHTYTQRESVSRTCKGWNFLMSRGPPTTVGYMMDGGLWVLQTGHRETTHTF